MSSLHCRVLLEAQAVTLSIMGDASSLIPITVFAWSYITP